MGLVTGFGRVGSGVAVSRRAAPVFPVGEGLTSPSAFVAAAPGTVAFAAGVVGFAVGELVAVAVSVGVGVEVALGVAVALGLGLALAVGVAVTEAMAVLAGESPSGLVGG